MKKVKIVNKNKFIKTLYILKVKKFAPIILKIITPMQWNRGVVITFASTYIFNPLYILYIFWRFHPSSHVVEIV